MLVLHLIFVQQCSILLGSWAWAELSLPPSSWARRHILRHACLRGHERHHSALPIFCLAVPASSMAIRRQFKQSCHPAWGADMHCSFYSTEACLPRPSAIQLKVVRFCYPSRPNFTHHAAVSWIELNHKEAPIYSGAPCKTGFPIVYAGVAHCRHVARFLEWSVGSGWCRTVTRGRGDDIHQMLTTR